MSSAGTQEDLEADLYAELMTFLTNSPYDVAIILESKWQESMEYTGWTAVLHPFWLQVQKASRGPYSHSP